MRKSIISTAKPTPRDFLEEIFSQDYRHNQVCNMFKSPTMVKYGTRRELK